MKNSFEDKLNKLRELHDKHPMVIDYEIDYIISKYDRKGKIDPKKLKIYLSVAFVILCILLGLVNINSNVGELGWITYYAALIFFLVGLGIGFNLKGFGLVFLFSHGGTGLGIMLIPIISSLKLKVYLSDNPTFLSIYLGIIIISVILAVVLSILYNLNDRLKDNLKAYTLILILYLVAITMVVILPKLLPYLL